MKSKIIIVISLIILLTTVETILLHFNDTKKENENVSEFIDKTSTEQEDTPIAEVTTTPAVSEEIPESTPALIEETTEEPKSDIEAEIDSLVKDIPLDENLTEVLKEANASCDISSGAEMWRDITNDEKEAVINILVSIGFTDTPTEILYNENFSFYNIHVSDTMISIYPYEGIARM